jgi:hypothetical protein
MLYGATPSRKVNEVTAHSSTCRKLLSTVKISCDTTPMIHVKEIIRPEIHRILTGEEIRRVQKGDWDGAYDISLIFSIDTSGTSFRHEINRLRRYFHLIRV